MKIERGDNELFAKAKDSALHYLAYRSRTRKEIVNKLREYPDDVVDDVIVMLEKYGYINDFEFAQCYVQSRVRNKGYGKIRLEGELREKGVETGIIDTVLSELDFDEVAAAVQKLRRKAIGAFTEKDMKRYSDYLTRQGFGYDVIKQAFSALRTQSCDK